MRSHEIIIVDDDEITLAMLTDWLSDYRINTFLCPNEAYLHIQNADEVPALIILDLVMPNINGLDMCQKIQGIFRENRPDIFIYTSSNEIEERIRGFELGVTDFLLKPCRKIELQQKVKNVYTRHKQLVESNARNENQHNFLSSTITELAEQNNVIHFLKALNNIHSAEELAKLILRAMSDFGLKSSIYMEYELDGSQRIYFDTNSNTMSPLERELLKRIWYSDKIITRGQRLFLNFPFFSQIIKNIPDDQERAGRLRDYVAIMLDAAGSRLRNILQTQEINSLLENLAELQLLADNSNRKQIDEIAKTLAILIEHVERNVFEYNLTEYQETELLELFKKSSDTALSIANNGSSVVNLDSIMARLKYLSSMAKKCSDESDEIEFF